ncbi:haloacid dehalogenase [Gulosibacter molinativorax]|uniref:Haloacid dehalogenase n=2 Tax=Gulosibacter molinativorax TaxID=256821 RepID=A0ABT7C6S2_9MICO|nr:haloacid dehalogenase [Gulosibacter molinativorax]
MPLGTGVAPFTAVLWDLDGTISDSAAGIIEAMRKTYDVFRMPIPSDDTLLSYVGPPIIDSFKAEHLDDQIEILHALETYREIHEESGLVDSPAFAGLPELVRDVRRAGIPQSTATSKPESAASRVLHYYGIADEFDFITGATDDESRSKKEDVVEEAVRRLREKGVDLSNVIMIGDRFYDVQGAAQHGIPTIYVNWGYGQVGEDEGAVAVASNAHELRELLGL